MKASYLYNGVTYTDFSNEFMTSLGMDEETIDSVQAQAQFEESKTEKLKAEAYQREADPKFTEWQKELAMGNPAADDYKDAWLSKCEQIKQRFTSK